MVRVSIRRFAKLVKVNNGCGLNILIFDFKAGNVVQKITDDLGLGLSAKFTDFRYNDDLNKLVFVVDGKIEEMRMYEITMNTMAAIDRPDNWKNLCHGLSIKSPKTLDWCVKHGIYS